MSEREVNPKEKKITNLVSKAPENKAEKKKQ